MKRPSSAHKTRRNRFKQDVARQGRRWWGRALITIKVAALLLAVVGASVLFMAGYATVTSADYFRTQTILVEGNRRLSTETILSQAGIRRGENLLAINMRLVRERLLEHPWIEAARVTREIPETIVIRVQEQVPWARIDMGRRFLMNRSGRIFKEVEDHDPDDLPLVSGIGFKDLSVNEDRMGAAMATVVAVLQLSERQTGPLAYGQIDQLHMDAEMGVTLTLRADQRIVKLGLGTYDLKFERYQRLTGHLASNGRRADIVAVDLINPDRVVVQLGSPL